MDNQIIVPHVEGAQGIRPAMLFESDHLEPIVILRASDRYFVDVLQRYKTAVREDPNADPALLAALDDAIIAANQWRSSGNPVASPAAPLPQKPFMLPADMKITAEATGLVTPAADNPDAQTITADPQGGTFTTTRDDVAQAIRDQAPSAVAGTPENAAALKESLEQAEAGDTSPWVTPFRPPSEADKALGVDLATPGGDKTVTSEVLPTDNLTAAEIADQLGDATIRDAIARRGGFISANASTAQCAALLADLGYPVGKP